MTDNRTTGFVDEPDTIRNEFMDDDLLIANDRTTEKLMREFVAVACECEVRDCLISEYAERIEQAIAATLGNEREAKLIRAMEDVLRHATDTVWVGEAETLVDRMVSLGVYKHDVYEGVRPWEATNER